MKKALFILAGLWMPQALAYPWMFFRQKSEEEIVKLDASLSYFETGQATAFVGSQLNYHNRMADLNLGWTYSFLEKSHYFRVSELAVVFPFISEKWKMRIGFRDHLWSEADRYWNYGLFQPRYLLDPLRPVQMGLPGLYLDYSKGGASFLFLFSYFYLPDIVIYPKLKNNRVGSKNPFFVESLTKFYWDIEELELFQIRRFFKPLIAFQLRHSAKNSGVSFSYAYKPVNQLKYSVSAAQANLSGERRDQITVRGFDYSVLSHHLANLEGELALAKNLSLFASVFYGRPEKKPLKNWISDEFEPHLTFSVLAYFQERWEEKSKTLFTLGWTKTDESRKGESASNAVTEDMEQAFGRGFDWKEALSASIEHQNKSLLQGLLFRARANYALDNGVYALALESYFYLSSRVRLSVSADALFRRSDDTIKKNSSAIKKYENLSRALLGVQYVF